MQAQVIQKLNIQEVQQPACPVVTYQQDGKHSTVRKEAGIIQLSDIYIHGNQIKDIQLPQGNL